MSYNENPQSMVSGSNTDLKDICSQTESDLFASGYHPFFQTNCNTCHVSGPGKGTFASPDEALAFASFQTMGFEKLSAMAINDSHNYPYTGSHHLEQINNLKTQWQTYQIEKSKCSSSTTSPTPTSVAAFTPNFITIKKIIPSIKGTPSTVNVNGSMMNIVTYNTSTVTYDLDQELSALSDKSLPVTSGATLTVSITGYSNPSGATGYLIQMPKLKTSTSSLKFNGMHVLINGRPVNYAYTFQHIDKSIYKLSEVMLSGGSMLALGPMSEGDQISLSIGSIEVIDMPEPLAAPVVQFDIATATILKTELGSAIPYKVGVSITGDNSNPLSVALSITGNEALANIAKGPMDVNGRHRFNWDYRINSSLSISFLPGETTKFIEIVFSDDLRDEVDKTLTLTLTDPFGGTLGAKKNLVLTIPDYNPANTDSVTFTQLMSPGGILEMNCVRCHNSLDRQGGYDMTDYAEMVSKGIIVPGNLTPNDHKMFRRMNPFAPDAGLVTPMPLDNYLASDLVDFVNLWILAGAKNN